jgi:hypothetical protein
MKRFTDWFRRKPAAPALRNTAGGMAWICGLDDVADAAGCEVLNGRAVRTLQYRDGKWAIDPPQRFTVRRAFTYQGWTYPPGAAIKVIAIQDANLEPWKDTGITESEVCELFAPRLSSVEAA